MTATTTSLGDESAAKGSPQAFDWLAFCNPEQDSGINEPFVVSGFKIATDGRIMIAVPTGERDSEPREDGRRRPNAMPLIKPVLSQIQAVEWQSLPKFEPHSRCESTGTITLPCEVCNGELSAQCNMGHWHECNQCEKTGKQTIPCGCYVIVANRCIDSAFFSKIESLENAKWHAPNSDDGDALWFRFGEMENCVGLVMPLSAENIKDDPEHVERKLVTA